MEFVLLTLGLLLAILGILGSFLPVLPGPLTSWFGLLVLHFTDAVPMNWWFLGTTLGIALVIFLLDYAIPAIGTKKFGGSKAGMIGTSIGLVVGILAPIPFGIIIGPFVGAFAGEMIHQNNSGKALKAAFGSFLGFLTGAFLKFVVATIFLGLFIGKVWDYRDAFFRS